MISSLVGLHHKVSQEVLQGEVDLQEYLHELVHVISSCLLLYSAKLQTVRCLDVSP